MSDKKEELTADNPELAKVGNEQLTAVAGGGSPGYKIIRLSYMITHCSSCIRNRLLVRYAGNQYSEMKHCMKTISDA